MSLASGIVAGAGAGAGLAARGEEARSAQEAKSAGALPALDPTFPFVLDETQLLAGSTEGYLDRILRRLQDETGLKVRVICPPDGLQNDRERFTEYLTPIKRRWGIDQMSLVLVAEQRVQKRTGRTMRLLSIQPGFRLQERFQYRLTQDYLIGTADRYGFPPTVAEKGTDLCIRGATENVVAALFSMVDDPNKGYVLPLPEEDVTAILSGHGVERLL